MKLARAIRFWLQRMFSEQSYDERLEAREGAFRSPPSVGGCVGSDEIRSALNVVSTERQY